MDVYVLDNNLAILGVVDQYQSFIWTERYYDCGDCELYVRATKTNRELLKTGNFLTKQSSGAFCRIVSVEAKTDANNGSWMIVKGKDARSILNQRVVIQQKYVYSQRARSIIQGMIEDNLTNASQADRNISMNVNTSDVPDDECRQDTGIFYLFDKIVEICKMFGYGSKMTWSAGGIVPYGSMAFKLYVGTDRSRSQSTNPWVVFSEDFNNLAGSDYTFDVSNYKNAAYIAGEGEGVDRMMVQIDEGSGLDRYELFVDAKSLSKKGEGGDLTDAQYDHMLLDYGKEQLTGHIEISTFSGTILTNADTYKYGTDYSLGDIVTIQNPLGISYDARVIEVIESDDAQNGHVYIPKFENIRLTT